MWSLDWFSAAPIARAGGKIRRVGWLDYWLVVYRGVWWIQQDDGSSHVVKSTEFGEDELRARDWTDEEVAASVCGGILPYNTTAPVFGSWTDDPVFTPPPIPGYPDEP